MPYATGRAHKGGIAYTEFGPVAVGFAVGLPIFEGARVSRRPAGEGPAFVEPETPHFGQQRGGEEACRLIASLSPAV